MTTTGVGQCPQCGSPNPYTFACCDKCGSRLPWADTLSVKAQWVSDPPPSPPQSTYQAPIEDNRSVRWENIPQAVAGCGAFLGCAVPLFLAAGVFLFIMLDMIFNF